MSIMNHEKRLCQILCEFPFEYNFRYTAKTARDLKRILFTSLCSDSPTYLTALFQDHVPGLDDEWDLSQTQGKAEDMEYTEAARGKPCGHIFKSGDSVFRCKTCTDDDTAVLCTRCFEASDHPGHIISRTISLGNSGCCDCGDQEAWKLQVNCAIHTEHEFQGKGKMVESSPLPEDLLVSIKRTISRVLDYFIDVVSCSPENLRLAKTEESIRLDEEQSRLTSVWYNEREDTEPEFALVLWNDEKHTILEVQDQVAKACKQRLHFGREKADETNDYGRSVVEYSKDVRKLLKIAKVIEQIKITVTIRSSRDTFREQMCGTIVEWLNDISGCSVGTDHDILRQAICEEFFAAWRLGSEASNKDIGKDGLDDHDMDDIESDYESLQRRTIFRHLLATRTITPAEDATTNSSSDDDDNDAGNADAIAADTTAVDAMEAEYNFTDEQIERLEAQEEEMLRMDFTARETSVENQDGRVSDGVQDGLEVSEATFAGYPPPPPPPPAPAREPSRSGPEASGSHDSGATNAFGPFASRTNVEIPITPQPVHKKNKTRPPAYWLQQPAQCWSHEPLPAHEDLLQRIRIDWLLLYDLRLWKTIRTDLRDLYITTLISSPASKRIFGLRFAGLYSVLGQLYLIADREPDHSIVNMSVQTFTTPSVTEEVIERGNFLTTLFSMLYTFLTQRTVQHPWQVSVDDSMASENNSVSNRRMYHFFSDLRYMFGAKYVRTQLREQERYQLQFLDLIRLPQGICPNIRAVGEHVEYENDIWISAQFLTKEINKLCRQYAEIFSIYDGANESQAVNALRLVTKATIVNSMGGERMRFDQAEIKFETRMKSLEPFYFEQCIGKTGQYEVVDFVVEKEAISFHHALHYTMSWLIDGVKFLPLETLRSLLTFTQDELRQPPPYKALVSDQNPEDYLLAVFDFPLRVCAWLAQMKAGMWVRNGLSLRHQMTTYRGVVHRDLAHHRDIFSLQTALVVCDHGRVLASMIDRFGMESWMRGDYAIRDQFEPMQQLDVAEDFIHLLIVLLCDRTSLQIFENTAEARAAAMRRDIAHILCFKPLSFSDLDTRFADKSTDLEDYPELLEEMTVFKIPEGLSDTGTFELKPEYLAEVDPYAAHYTKNQRDEAENTCRSWLAKVYSKPIAEVVYEPRLHPLESGIFCTLAKCTTSPLFVQIVFFSLNLSLNTHRIPTIPMTRVEAYLQVVLHLTLVAVLESHSADDMVADDKGPSFAEHALHLQSELGVTIFDLLIKILDHNDLNGCHPRIRLILHRIRQRQPERYLHAVSRSMQATKGPTIDKLGFESPMTPMGDDQEVQQKYAQKVKKQLALDRQARVMAQFQEQQQQFLSNQDMAEWDEDDDNMHISGKDEHVKLWKYPAGNCIMCQEETNESRLYGTFSLLTQSNIFRQTDSADPDLISEVLSLPENLDRSPNFVRPFGLAGQNRSKILRRTADGEEKFFDHEKVARGHPISYSTRGPVSTGCGHIMHYSCFEMYCAATVRRQQHQVARQHAERRDLREFVCPLCKALGNSFLPIIWVGKEEAIPAISHPALDLNKWLNTSAESMISKFHKSQKGKLGNDCVHDSMSSYASKNMISALITKSSVPKDQSSVTSPTSPRSAQMLFANLPGLWPSDSGTTTSPDHQMFAESAMVDELLSVYARLHSTFVANKLPSRYPCTDGNVTATTELANTDILATTLGYSITATEIAQRGVKSPENQLVVHSIPSSIFLNLRILSETATSYIATGNTKLPESSTTSDECYASIRTILSQLFIGHPQVRAEENAKDWIADSPPAFSCDSFGLLTNCSVFLVPNMELEIQPLIHLCYVLELVKITISLMLEHETFDRCAEGAMEAQLTLPAAHIDVLKGFMDKLSNIVTSRPFVAETPLQDSVNKIYDLMYRAISRYALVFLRKTAILLHIRHGFNFSEVLSDDTEIIRLSRVLNLPLPIEIMNTILHTNNEAVLSMSIHGWIRHWQIHEHQLDNAGFDRVADGSLDTARTSAHKTMRPGHPVIFELIGLPRYFDAVTYEVTRRRCPTKKSKLEDASLCLFCGDLFCGQALCCTREGKGGCYQHMQKCGQNVGLFLNVRKCMILYLNNENGSWNYAPYLDKYGEPDPGLRRGRQLILNQKRYDNLYRDEWLQHGIPTMIARRLEAEINNGGWETL